MSAYMVVELTVKDPAGMDEYRKQTGPIVTRFGGRFMARPEPCLRLEGEWARVAIVEFPDLEAAKAFYESEEYRPLIKLRKQASEGRIIVVGGA
jgi:uncharacterized protein (DUF1330 family)